MARWDNKSEYPYDSTPAGTDEVMLVNKDQVTTLTDIGTLLGIAAAATNLTWTASTRTVASSTGTDAVITVATSSEPGLMSSALFDLLALAPGVTSGVVAPSSTPSKIGNLYVDTALPGLYFAKGIASSADWILVASTAAATNLTWTASTKVLASSTGTDATLTDVDGTNSGLMTPALRALVLTALQRNTGSGAPITTPTVSGEVYVDTTDDRFYFSVGTASSADWKEAGATTIQHHYDVITFPSDVADEDPASAWRCPTTGTLVEAIIWCDTAPVNGVITSDLLKNGTTVFTGGTNRPSIAISSKADVSGAPSITTMVAGDLFQVQVKELHASDQGNIGQLLCQIHWTQTI